jgi:transcriptional regulator with XRE-family HTH domain
MATKKRRSKLESDAVRVLSATLRSEGAKVRAARRRRRWTQTALGRRAELSQQTISQLERGDGATLSVAAWKRVALALDVPLELRIGRDRLEETRDAGHLAMQELVLRLGRRVGYGRTFELATRPSRPGAWADVGLVDHVRRRLILVECVNVIDDIGSAVRASDRKQAEAAQLAVSLGDDSAAYAVHGCWLVRAARRNRQLIGRYPELFAGRFPGSSRGWVRALTIGSPPPMERGLIWCDLAATRVFEWRRAPG